MRWDNLFDELESQLEQQLGAEEVDLLAEEERLRLGRLALRDRVREMGVGGEPLTFALVDGSRMSVTVDTVGRDWLAGQVIDSARRATACVVPLASLASVFPTPDQLARGLAASVDEPGPASLGARLGLTFVLRDLCRRRAAVDISTPAGLVHGTIDRVARDHLDLAEHERGVPRRAYAVTGIRMLPLTEIVVVRL